MMKAIGITDAASKLDQLVDSLHSSGDVVITRGDEPVARLTTVDGQPSLFDLKPSSVGAILSPSFASADNLLSEMLDS